ncbi:MAG TPA: DUF4157 domain-containing protein [Myxococcota bacterium]|nr:DUF4157 domain-containing protein [Myxococcota bacterium]
MRKTEFMDELHAAVCDTARDALRGTAWSAAGCPWMDRWFSHFRAQSAAHNERALRRYAPQAAAANTARDYIPAVSARVRAGIERWSTTGEMPDLPEGISAADLTGGGLAGAAAGLMSGIAGAVGRVVRGIGSFFTGLFSKSRTSSPRAAADPVRVGQRLGSGASLPADARARMESAFGQNFAAVRVHDDAGAASLSDELGSRAFSVGEHVAFGAGEFRPGSVVGDALLAHELAHVVQQRGATPPSAPLPKGAPSNEALEHDADDAAVGAVMSLWSGARGATIPRESMPRLRAGLRLSRCGPSAHVATDVELRRYLTSVQRSRAIQRGSQGHQNARQLVELWRREPGTWPLSVGERKILVLELMDGGSNDDDQRAILTILRQSTVPDMIEILREAGPADLEGRFGGDQLLALRELYRARAQESLALPAAVGGGSLAFPDNYLGVPRCDLGRQAQILFAYERGQRIVANAVRQLDAFVLRARTNRALLRDGNEPIVRAMRATMGFPERPNDAIIRDVGQLLDALMSVSGALGGPGYAHLCPTPGTARYDQLCPSTRAGNAIASWNRRATAMTFCPSFFSRSTASQTWTVIHEVTHASVHDARTEADERYCFATTWPMEWGQSLFNADSYTAFAEFLDSGINCDRSRW